MKEARRLAGWLVVTVATALLALAGSGAAAPTSPQDTLVIAYYYENVTLDASAATQRSVLGVVKPLIFNGLIRRDARGRYQPDLAESWRLVDPTTWEFKLRRGVRFHNGENFDAESVKFTFERLLDPKRRTAQGFYWTGIKAVEIIDPFTVRVTTHRPMGPFLSTLALASAMLPPKAYSPETFDVKPIGTGPFRFVRWARGERLEVEANPTYWEGPPKSRRIIYLPIVEDSTRIAGIQTGQIHIAHNVPIPLADSLKRAPDVSVEGALSSITQELSVAGDARPPLGNPLVLQAVNLAINREHIVKNVFRGFARVPRSVFGPMVFGAHPSQPHLKYDPDRAKALMAEAGLPGGVEVEMWYVAGAEVQIADIVQAVAEDLRRIGIRTRIRVAPDWGAGGPILHGKRFDLFYNGWASPGLDPDLYFWGNYHPDGRNREGVDKYPFGHEVVQLVECGRFNVDPDVRKGCYLRLQEILWQHPTRVPIVVPHDLYAIRKEVKGFVPRSDLVWDLKNTYVERSR